jgi:hypothetical protein
LDNNLESCIVVQGLARGNPQEEVLSIGITSYVQRWPVKDLAMRLELDSQRLFVRSSHFSSWCKRQKVSAISILEYLKSREVWDGQKIKYDLGAGVSTIPSTPILSYQFELSKCVELNLDKFEGD